LVILLVKLTTVVLHHRGRTDFSKAQTATVVGITVISHSYVVGLTSSQRTGCMFSCVSTLLPVLTV
jgi:hypothetical protein